MYTKTQWVDNTTPIDKDNLNKIEQGIYDNSLVVDAVTDKLNPTDTETYKTAELTEGQITDVIGVSDIVIKGQTSQVGEPTPSAPVDVNVVSGSNVISTENENLFPLILDVDGTQILQQRCNVIIQKDEFIFTATGTDMYFGNVATANSAYQKLQGKLIKIPTNAQNIYLKVSNNAFSNNFICFFDENKVSLGYSNISTSKEVPNTAKYFTLRIGVSNSVSGTTYKTKVMVSTMNKAYVPHQGKELHLDLPVENLLNISNDINTTTSGITVSLINTDTIDFNGVASNTYISTATVNLTKPLESGKTYCFKAFGNNDSNLRFRIWGYNSNNELKFNIIDGNSLTLNTNIIKYKLVLEGLTANNKYNVQAKFQVSEAPYINTYTSYGTDPIELCKIGNYQDYFYKSGSKWYLHKETIKTIINGSTDQTILYSNFLNALVYTNSNIANVSQSSLGNIICNRAVEIARNTLTTNNGICLNDEANRILIKFDGVSSYNTEALAREYFANNPYEVIYKASTTTDTEITNTTLISQLEAIYNAPLYEQTNITQENNDLPMVLDITACKDNINGIKAFIRK